ncbi:helix-turn-helix domain-containing protein [Rhizobium leguminosarum]|uniref:helix-turn-helix domain-containing protein n=1 Tax=Rhizobium leguminosarum TaxID=384 RepID=UPI0015F8571D|nr:helix-turn-helix transcriptional regulator [Rhizobium leguminosarum]MBA9031755.1 transcriptional regulator with XRE-family HTH domain [Rhizobium leguminosarum]
MTQSKADRLAQQIKSRGLVESREPGNSKPVFRKPGFRGVQDFGALENARASSVRRERKAAGLSRETLADMVGIAEQVYARYERAASHLTATRLIHLCELLAIEPTRLLHDVAPHLWGATKEEADNRTKLALLLRDVPADVLPSLIDIVMRLTPAPSHRGEAPDLEGDEA